MAIDYSRLETRHRRAYVRRYKPTPVVRESGVASTPSGSSWCQWRRLVRPPAGASEVDVRQIYAKGFKPADATEELARRLKARAAAGR